MPIHYKQKQPDESLMTVSLWEGGDTHSLVNRHPEWRMCVGKCERRIPHSDAQKPMLQMTLFSLVSRRLRGFAVKVLRLIHV